MKTKQKHDRSIYGVCNGNWKVHWRNVGAQHVILSLENSREIHGDPKSICLVFDYVSETIYTFPNSYFTGKHDKMFFTLLTT